MHLADALALLDPCSTVWAKGMQNAKHGLFGEKVIILPELYLYLIVYWSHNNKTSLKIKTKVVSHLFPAECWPRTAHWTREEFSV